MGEATAVFEGLAPRSGLVQRPSSPAAMERSGIAVRVQRLVIRFHLPDLPRIVDYGPPPKDAHRDL